MCACACASCSQMWMTSILPTHKYNLILWCRSWEKQNTTGFIFSFLVQFFAFLLFILTFILFFSLSTLKIPHCQDSLSIWIPPFPPSLSFSLLFLCCYLMRVSGCWQLCLTHSWVMLLFRRLDFINRAPYWVTEQTNFGPAENPLAVSINTDTGINPRACTRRNAHTHTYAQVCTKQAWNT